MRLSEPEAKELDVWTQFESLEQYVFMSVLKKRESKSFMRFHKSDSKVVLCSEVVMYENGYQA